MSGKKQYWRAWILQNRENNELFGGTLCATREELEQKYLNVNTAQRKEWHKKYRIREIEYRVIDGK